jgi:hypothetical protein
MVRFKKRGAREIVWGPEEPWVEPKKEVILGPAGTPSDVGLASSSSSESALGFLGAMVGAAEPSSSTNSSSISGSSERPASSPYGYDPTESSSGSSYSDSSSSSSTSSLSSDHLERLERLHRKLDRTIERIEEIERKMNRVQDKLDLREY